MQKKCILCDHKIEENHSKLNGTIIRSKDETNKNQLIYVCTNCQKTPDWYNEAKIKGV